VQPAVSILNYTRTGTLSQITFAGFSLYIINFTGSVREAVVDGAGGHAAPGFAHYCA
jgi:hypothetical protein